jgi:hypothetical protein
MRPPAALVGALTVSLSASVSIGIAVPAVATGTTAKRPPAPCKTFTIAAADRLFGVEASITPAEHPKTTDKGKDTETRTCKVTTGDDRLDVSTSFVKSSFAGPFETYPKPKLGHSGEILVSTSKTFPETVATYERHDVFFADVINRIVKHHGRKLYRFALKQSNAFAKRNAG